MLTEALESLAAQAVQAQEARELKLPGDGRVTYVDQGGTLTKYDVSPPLRSHRVDSVDDLIAAAKKWNKSPVVWLNGDSIVLLPDDADRRDKVSLPLVKSHQFATLVRLGKEPMLDQQGLVRLLRIDLQGAAGRADLLAVVRKIKWRQSSAGDASIQHGSESLGKSIEAEVSGAGAIPEQVLVSCPVYQNHGEREFKVSILCDLEIDAASQKFRFRPLPDEIERVTDAALDGIRSRIADALPDTAMFYGTP